MAQADPGLGRRGRSDLASFGSSFTALWRWRRLLSRRSSVEAIVVKNVVGVAVTIVTDGIYPLENVSRRAFHGLEVMVLVPIGLAPFRQLRPSFRGICRD